jgi:YVTN family beta-propeller protein
LIDKTTTFSILFLIIIFGLLWQAQEISGSSNTSKSNEANHSADGINVGYTPVDIDVNPITNKLYVANGGFITSTLNHSTSSITDPSLTIINGATNAIDGNVSLGPASSVAVNPINNKVYVTLSKTLLIFNANNNTLEKKISLGKDTAAVAANNLTNQVYVVRSNFIDVIEGNTSTIEASIHTNTTCFRDINHCMIDVNPRTNTVYFANSKDNTVQVLNTNTNTLESNITVGESLSSIAVNPTNNKVYVINSDGNRIYSIDPNSNNKVETYTFGISPIYGKSLSPPDIALNPKTNMIYISNPHFNSVYAVDKSMKMVANITLNDPPEDLAVNTATDLVYVTEPGSYANMTDFGTISIINGKDNTLVEGSKWSSKEENKLEFPGITIGEDLAAVAVNKKTNKVYVADEFNDALSIFNTLTGTLKDIPGEGVTEVGVNPVTNKVYFGGHFSNITTVLDGNTDKLLANITIGEGVDSIAIDPENDKVYVAIASLNGDIISTIDGSSYDVEGNITIECSVCSIDINPNTQTIYSTALHDKIAVIDVNTNRIVSNITVGSYPVDVAVNPRTNLVYVANEGSDYISVIDGYANRVIQNITGISPIDLAINIDTNTIYASVREELGESKISIINGTTGSEVKHIDGLSGDLAVNPITNFVYVAGDKLVTFNGSSNKVLVGEKFSTIPSVAGNILCNDNGVSNNHLTYYDIGSSVKCEARPNSGYSFSSWSGDLISNSSNNMMDFAASGYGTLYANFVEPVNITVPPEFWAPFYAIIPGFFIPSLITWFNGRRQRGYLSRYRKTIDDTYSRLYDKKDECVESLNNVRIRITEEFERGRLSESYYNLLNSKILDYTKQLNKVR